MLVQILQNIYQQKESNNLPIIDNNINIQR